MGNQQLAIGCCLDKPRDREDQDEDFQERVAVKQYNNIRARGSAADLENGIDHLKPGRGVEAFQPILTTENFSSQYGDLEPSQVKNFQQNHADEQGGVVIPDHDYFGNESVLTIKGGGFDDVIQKDKSTGAPQVILFDDDFMLSTDIILETQADTGRSTLKLPENPKTPFGDDMSAFMWDGPEDSDEEIPEMAALKSSYEIAEGIKFSKNGIKKYVEAQIEKESKDNKKDPKTAKLWEEKLKLPGISMCLKKGGSHISESQPYLRTESNYKKTYKMEKLLSCVSTQNPSLNLTSLFEFIFILSFFQIYLPEHQKKWDEVLQSSEKTPVNKNAKCYGLNYTNNKKQYTIASRDFFEKGFNFYSDGKFYRYSTSVPNSESPGPNGEPPLKALPNDKTVRGFTNINCGLVYRDPKTGKIYNKVITQCDFMISVPSWMLTSFLPSATKSWY